MKTIYSTLLAAFIGVSAFAQSATGLRDVPSGNRPLNPVQRHSNPNSAQSTMSFYTDYGFMDEDYQLNTNGFPYQRFIWDMNRNYSLAQGDTSIRWATVDFDPLFDSYNGSVQIAQNSFNSITIDSIFFNAGHSNYSGQNDTLLVRIIQCSSAGYPTTTAIILHTDTIISNTSMTASSTWLSNGTFYTAPNYTINNNTTKFAVRIDYYGSHSDTFGLTAGFADMQQTCSALPTLPYVAAQSNYFPNSYRHDMYFSQPPNSLQQLPTTSGGDSYYDCDGVNGNTIGTDSQNYLQNWDIWIHATISGVGIDETNAGLSVGQNVPNPSTGNTEIPYELKNNDNVTLTVYDVTGNAVMTQNVNSTSGHHTFQVATTDLAGGVYYYTVATSEGSITHKMVVAK